MNDYSDINAERCDWVGIDEKIDMDKDGKVGEDPPGDMNGDGYPGEAGTDDDNDGLTDEDSQGRQPGEPGYTNDLMEDDDEDGRIEEGEILGLNEDPGGFDDKWDHVIMIKSYSWIDPKLPGNEEYKKTLGHKYDFIHACPNPGYVAEQDQFRYSIIYATGHETGTIYSIQFRRPTVLNNKEVDMFNKLLSIIIFSIVFAQGAKASLKYDYDIHGGEKYIIKEVAFIPWGEEDSLLGFIPSVAEVNEKGDTGMIHPGYGVRSWDVGKDGKIYVADEVKIRVLVYDSNGHYLRSIGIWDLDTNEIYVKATSGEEKVISPFQPEKYNKEERRFYPFTYKTYFDYPSDVSVDGMGNVYVIPSLYASCVYKFSPEGKLLEIIDQFGDYGVKDIRSLFHLESNSYGSIILALSLKPKGRKVIEFESDGKYRADARMWRDLNGNEYWPMRPSNEIFKTSNKFDIGIYRGDKGKKETISIYFESPKSVTFYGIDGDGNLYFGVGWALHKYDQKGNLLAIIQGKPDTTRTFKNAMPGMAAVSKVMANGDIYDAYMCDQGFVVYKYEFQQETKGQILKPAVKPEKN